MTTETNQARRIYIRGARRGLHVALSMSIDEALRMLAVGQAEKARLTLEDALRHATSVSDECMSMVGLEAVRGAR